MAQTPSTMLPLGTTAPEFNLPDPTGRKHRLADFAESKALLVMFICNHCPFVQHVRKGIAEFARDYRDESLAIVAINANDVENYPDDSPEKMAEEIEAQGYTFNYLYDEDQSVAKAYQAACTPEFYLFDRERKLIYRGQFDGSRPGNDVPVSGRDLRSAVDQYFTDGAVQVEQKASVGCNIKWKAGNEPSYAAQA